MVKIESVLDPLARLLTLIGHFAVVELLVDLYTNICAKVLKKRCNRRYFLTIMCFKTDVLDGSFFSVTVDGVPVQTSRKCFVVGINLSSFLPFVFLPLCRDVHRNEAGAERLQT